MKKWLLMICFMLIIPGVASAHAELEDSQPKEGETVKNAIDTLTLQFGEEVEQFASFAVTNENGEKIPIEAPSISGKSVMVLTKEPLPNGNYTAKWEVVAADGHKSPGQLTFKVEKVEEEKPAQTEKAAPAKENNQPQKQADEKQTDKKQTHSVYISVIIILIVILVIGVSVLFRRRGK
ncbi:MAG: copper resistance CopC family protein [Tuberibacillus sp.]